MASEKNPVDIYLAEKNAGAGSLLRGAAQGLRSSVSGIKPAAEYLAQGFSPIDAQSTARRVGQRLGEAVGRGGMQALGVGAAAAGVAGVQKLYNAATKARDFKTMLDNNEDLREQHQENPRLFNQLYSTLRTFNPSFSKDPIVAGTYMRQMMADPMSAGGKVVETIGFRDKMKNPLPDQLVRAASGGGKRSE